jgi:glutamyl-tRNA synthetase
LILGPERNYSGKVERTVVRETGKVVQFERFAFCRVEGVFSNGGGVGKFVRAIYTHP